MAQYSSPDINALAYALNAIELSEQDLLDVSLQAIRTYLKFNSKHEGMLDHLLGDGGFVHCALEITREAMILGMHTHLLTIKVDFNELIPLCFNNIQRLKFIDRVSENEETKIFFKDIFSYIAIESYSLTYSRNKEFMNVSSLTKEALEHRVSTFRRYAKFNEETVE